MTSRWAIGTRAPVSDEPDEYDLPVIGTSRRRWTGGSSRVTPNPIGAVDDDQVWFAGAGMVNALDICDGTARRFASR